MNEVASIWFVGTVFLAAFALGLTFANWLANTVFDEGDNE